MQRERQIPTLVKQNIKAKKFFWLSLKVNGFILVFIVYLTKQRLYLYKLYIYIYFFSSVVVRWGVLPWENNTYDFPFLRLLYKLYKLVNKLRNVTISTKQIILVFIHKKWRCFKSKKIKKHFYRGLCVFFCPLISKPQGERDFNLAICWINSTKSTGDMGLPRVSSLIIIKRTYYRIKYFLHELGYK